MRKKYACPKMAQKSHGMFTESKIATAKSLSTPNNSETTVAFNVEDEDLLRSTIICPILPCGKMFMQDVT